MKGWVLQVRRDMRPYTFPHGSIHEISAVLLIYLGEDFPDANLTPQTAWDIAAGSRHPKSSSIEDEDTYVPHAPYDAIGCQSMRQTPISDSLFGDSEDDLYPVG